MSTSTKSVAEVRRDMDRRGKTVRQVAQEIGVSDKILYGLLYGRFKGRRGQAHRAAVMLGLKDGSVE